MQNEINVYLCNIISLEGRSSRVISRLKQPKASLHSYAMSGFFYLKKMENNKLSFSQVLTLIFITLKLLNQIDWNWFLVLLPLIIGECFFIIAKLIIDKKYK